MIRCYRLDSKAQSYIDGLVKGYGANMSAIDLDLAQVLCQVQLELDKDGIFFYNAEVPNVIPAYGIMRLESRGFIKRDFAMECVYTYELMGIENEA